LSFSAEPREEIDLDALNVALVGETRRLADVSLWLRPDTSPKDREGQSNPIDESGEQTYAFCFRCLSK
jgi:hypothetical protein